MAALLHNIEKLSGWIHLPEEKNTQSCIHHQQAQKNIVKAGLLPLWTPWQLCTGPGLPPMMLNSLPGLGTQVRISNRIKMFLSVLFSPSH